MGTDPNSSLLTFRQAGPGDLPAMQNLFVNTIREVCKADYADSQVQAWSAGSGNKRRWDEMIAQQYVLVACSGDELTGFISLRHDGYVDMLYVHHDHQREGLASALYGRIEQKAMEWTLTFLMSDVSITARPFFEHNGFYVVKHQQVQVNGVTLTNFSMRKDL